MRYEFAKQALLPWLRKGDPMDPRVPPRAICDILSAPQMPEVSEEEMEVFDMVLRIMNRENSKWRSLTQIALPWEEMAGKVKNSSDARLKSRLGLPVIEDAGASEVTKPNEQMQLRRRFLDLVSMCVPMEERQRYPHILTLIDTHVVGTPQPPSPESSGVDVAAFCLVNYFKTTLLEQRLLPMQEHYITPDMPLDDIKANHEATLSKMEARIEALAWRQKLRDTPASNDSLFAQLLLNAALNRHCLETWSYERRLTEVLPMQVQVFEEISKTAPDGLEHALNAARTNGQIDYRSLVERVLAFTIAEKKKPMTENIQRRIANQVAVVISSAEAGHFYNEKPLNSYLTVYRMRAEALLWIMLTWCYQHEFEIATEVPSAERPDIPVVSKRSPLLVASQQVSTLRRMLSTPAFSWQWEKPSGQRLEMHAQQNSAIRTLARSKLEESLKGATLAQWEAAADQFVPRDGYCTLMQHAEVGSLMREYAVFNPVRLPLYG